MPFNDIFNDEIFVRSLQRRLPKLVYDLNEAFRKGGKLSPDIGNLREKMIIGILKKQYGDRLEYEFESQEPELDFQFDGEGISFKTTISKGFKLIWTANYELAMDFYKNSTPLYSIAVLLFQKKLGGLYYFPLELLVRTRERLGLEFLKKPKSGTNPRGVELSTKAFNLLIKGQSCRFIPINWNIIAEGLTTAVNFIDYYHDLW